MMLMAAAAGVLGSGPATSHPSVQDRLGEAEVRPEERVVRAGNVVTSVPGTKGPASSMAQSGVVS